MSESHWLTLSSFIDDVLSCKDMLCTCFCEQATRSLHCLHIVVVWLGLRNPKYSRKTEELRESRVVKSIDDVMADKCLNGHSCSS